MDKTDLSGVVCKECKAQIAGKEKFSIKGIICPQAGLLHIVEIKENPEKVDGLVFAAERVFMGQVGAVDELSTFKFVACSNCAVPLGKFYLSVTNRIKGLLNKCFLQMELVEFADAHKGAPSFKQLLHLSNDIVGEEETIVYYEFGRMDGGKKASCLAAFKHTEELFKAVLEKLAVECGLLCEGRRQLEEVKRKLKMVSQIYVYLVKLFCH